MSEEQVMIELTPEDLDAWNNPEPTDPKDFLCPEGKNLPCLVDQVEGRVSKRKGGYGLLVHLIPLADEDDLASADKNKKVVMWVNIPVRNANTGYEPPTQAKKLNPMKRNLRYSLMALGYDFGFYPIWDDKTNKSYDENGEVLDSTVASEIRDKVLGDVLNDAIALFNSKEKQDALVNHLVYCDIEHKESTWVKSDGTEQEQVQARVKNMRSEKREEEE
jgi:hypothetical protein